MSTTTVSPWGGLEENGRKTGLLDLFAEALADASGVTIENISRPYPRVIFEMESGQCDLAVMFSSPANGEFAQSLGTVVATNIMLIGRADSPDIKHLDDLGNKMVGHIRGSRYGTAFDQHPTILKVPVLTMEQGLNMLVRKRLDAMASADQTLYYTLREMGLSRLEIKPLLVLKTTTAELFISRKSSHKHLIPRFKKALDDLHINGTLTRIFYENGYYPTGAPRPAWN